MPKLTSKLAKPRTGREDSRERMPARQPISNSAMAAKAQRIRQGRLRAAASERESRGARLNASPSRVDFRPTPAGEEQRQSIAVVNDGAEAVLLEDGTILNDSPFHDFQLLVPNERIEPGQRERVTAVFSPSRPGQFATDASVLTDRGVGAVLELKGEAVETQVSEPDRIKNQDVSTEQSQLQGGPSNDPHHARRVRATNATRAWADAMGKHCRAVSEWSSDNWALFISRTGGDVFVPWSEGQFLNALGAVATGVSGLIAPGGPLGSFVVGTLVSEIWGAISAASSNAAAERAAHDAAIRVGDKIREKRGHFATQDRRAHQAIIERRSTAGNMISRATDGSEIEQWFSWLERETQLAKQAPPRGDESLFRELIQRWALQRAGTDKVANASTNAKAYSDARKAAFGLGDGESLQKPDLFMHQCRYEWSSLGLKGVDERIEVLQQTVNASQARGLDGAALAADLGARLDGRSMIFGRAQDPDRALAVLGPQNVNLDRGDMEKPIRCTILLESRGGAVIVKRFLYMQSTLIADRRPGQ